MEIVDGGSGYTGLGSAVDKEFVDGSGFFGDGTDLQTGTRRHCQGEFAAVIVGGILTSIRTDCDNFPPLDFVGHRAIEDTGERTCSTKFHTVAVVDVIRKSGTARKANFAATDKLSVAGAFG